MEIFAARSSSLRPDCSGGFVIAFSRLFILPLFNNYPSERKKQMRKIQFWIGLYRIIFEEVLFYTFNILTLFAIKNMAIMYR